MNITQLENGNIIITDNKGEIHHILPTAFVHKHPRLSDNAILISSNTDYTNEQSGISLLANDVHKVNSIAFKGTASGLLRTLSKSIALQGEIIKTDTTPKTKEQDPNYIAFIQANTFEKLLSFVKRNQHNIGGKKYQNGKLISEEFYSQFQTFSIRVTLTYYYQLANPTLIDYQLLSGSTQYIFKPIKRYLYNASNEPIGHKYEELNT